MSIFNFTQHTLHIYENISPVYDYDYIKAIIQTDH